MGSLRLPPGLRGVRAVDEPVSGGMHRADPARPPWGTGLIYVLIIVAVGAALAGAVILLGPNGGIF